MEPTIATTPFGARSVSLAQIDARRLARERPVCAGVNKWDLYSWIRIARGRLGIGERALTVLSALISFHADAILGGRQLVVFPSNATLALRANGMAPSTLRRHLGMLVEAGLVHRRDSPNGKRYARKGADGEVAIAFGFDLAPLVARACEFERMANEILEEQRLLRRLRERISLYRRDIGKLIAVGLEESVPLAGSLLDVEEAGMDDPIHGWTLVHARFRGLVTGLSRSASHDDLVRGETELSRLSAEILNHLEFHSKTLKMSTNGAHIEHHIQDSKPESSFDLEARNEKNEKPAAERLPDDARSESLPEEIATAGCGAERRTYPLELVLDACPDIADYAPGGLVRDWRTLEAAAATVRPMLGISPGAFEAACTVLGRQQAAITLAAILQRGTAIQSPGGYLRNLTARARLGAFSLSPVLAALVRKRRQAEEAACE
jgi:replication initiation protein RepC